MRKNFLRKAGIVALAASVALTFSVTGMTFADSTSESEAKAAYDTAKANYDKAEAAYDAADKAYQAAKADYEKITTDPAGYYKDFVAAAQTKADKASEAAKTAQNTADTAYSDYQTKLTAAKNAKADLDSAIANSSDEAIKKAYAKRDASYLAYNTKKQNKEAYDSLAAQYKAEVLKLNAVEKTIAEKRIDMAKQQAKLDDTTTTLTDAEKKAIEAAISSDKAAIAQNLTLANTYYANAKKYADEANQHILTANSGIATTTGMGFEPVQTVTDTTPAITADSKLETVLAGQQTESDINEKQKAVDDAMDNIIDPLKTTYDADEKALEDAIAQSTQITDLKKKSDDAQAAADQALTDWRTASKAAATAQEELSTANKELNAAKAEQDNYNDLSAEDKKAWPSTVGEESEYPQFYKVEGEYYSTAYARSVAKEEFDAAEHKRDNAYDVWQAAKSDSDSNTKVVTKLKKLKTPKNFKVKAIGKGKVKVSWKKVSHASYYRVKVAKKGTKAYSSYKTKKTSKILKLKKGKKYKIRVNACAKNYKNSSTKTKVVKVK